MLNLKTIKISLLLLLFLSFSSSANCLRNLTKKHDRGRTLNIIVNELNNLKYSNWSFTEGAFAYDSIIKIETTNIVKKALGYLQKKDTSTEPNLIHVSLSSRLTTRGREYIELALSPVNQSKEETLAIKKMIRRGAITNPKFTGVSLERIYQERFGVPSPELNTILNSIGIKSPLLFGSPIESHGSITYRFNLPKNKEQFFDIYGFILESLYNVHLIENP